MTAGLIRERRTPPEGLGPLLREARETARLTPAETARRVGVTASYLAKLERATRCPSVTVAQRLAAVLDLDAVQRAVVLAGAVDDAGADHPMRQHT
ncbi:helix-turn-helix domain-containing protein [Streptomyces sp. NPDC088812]|uniref:helix-turn-helix domain-containing protein n=1 Tax=Streptomyces sp. NPDC088812 TaxID=3365905 RepID=UPI0037FF7384